MNYEFNVALVITNFYYVAELSSHSPLKFNFPTSFLYLWPKATCLINSSLKIWLVFGSLLNLLPPPHTRSLMQKLSTAGFRFWFLSFLTAPAHNQFVSRDMEKCQYVFSKVPFILSLYPLGSKDYTFVYRKSSLKKKFEIIKLTLEVMNMQNEPFSEATVWNTYLCLSRFLMLFSFAIIFHHFFSVWLYQVWDIRPLSQSYRDYLHEIETGLQGFNYQEWITYQWWKLKTVYLYWKQINQTIVKTYIFLIQFK